MNSYVFTANKCFYLFFFEVLLVNILMTLFLFSFSGNDVECVLYDACAATTFQALPTETNIPWTVLFIFARVSFSEDGQY